MFDYAANIDGDPELSYDEYGMAITVMKKIKDDAKSC